MPDEPALETLQLIIVAIVNGDIFGERWEQIYWEGIERRRIMDNDHRLLATDDEIFVGVHRPDSANRGKPRIASVRR
jgi:hypothetical protein